MLHAWNPVVESPFSVGKEASKTRKAHCFQNQRIWNTHPHSGKDMGNGIGNDHLMEEPLGQEEKLRNKKWN